ncbi:MAG: hypothetical protein IKH24_00435 [Bacteroidales bacterium]|nr:hypothetical protein [Bacteroidales bacterium]MCR4922151.1 hypothetical protein [Bacteroidaceae bacterium]
MPIRFSLDSRPNKKGEYPIRYTWSYTARSYSAKSNKIRIQSTLGRSSTKEAFLQETENEISLFLKDIEQKIKRIERQSRWLSREEMEAFMHQIIKGDEENVENHLLQEKDLKNWDEEIRFRKKKENDSHKHIYEKITEARDPHTNKRLIIFRKLSGRGLLYVMPEEDFIKEYTVLK